MHKCRVMSFLQPSSTRYRRMAVLYRWRFWLHPYVDLIKISKQILILIRFSSHLVNSCCVVYSWKIFIHVANFECKKHKEHFYGAWPVVYSWKIFFHVASFECKKHKEHFYRAWPVVGYQQPLLKGDANDGKPDACQN